MNIQTVTRFYPDREAETTVEITLNDVPVFKTGDKVRVVDGSHNRDAVTKETRFGIDPLFKNNIAEVIKTGCNQWIQFHIEKDVVYNTNMDLLLKFPNGELIYCSRVCVNSINEKDFERMLATTNQPA